MEITIRTIKGMINYVNTSYAVPPHLLQASEPHLQIKCKMLVTIVFYLVGLYVKCADNPFPTIFFRIVFKMGVKNVF